MAHTYCLLLSPSPTCEVFFKIGFDSWTHQTSVLFCLVNPFGNFLIDLMYIFCWIGIMSWLLMHAGKVS